MHACELQNIKMEVEKFCEKQDRVKEKKGELTTMLQDRSREVNNLRYEREREREFSLAWFKYRLVNKSM